MSLKNKKIMALFLAVVIMLSVLSSGTAEAAEESTAIDEQQNIAEDKKAEDTESKQPVRENDRDLADPADQNIVDGKDSKNDKDSGVEDAVDDNTEQEPGKEEDPKMLETQDVSPKNLDQGKFRECTNAENGVRLSWEKIEKANGYYLYRKVSGKGEYKKIRTIDSKDVLSTLDKDVTSGTIYYYKIKAYTGKKKEAGKESAEIKIMYLVSTNVNIKKTGTKVQVRWKRVPGAKGYLVYRKDASKKAEWKQVSDIREPGEIIWRDQNTENGKFYYYTVKVKNGKYLSAYAPQTLFVSMQAPKIKGWKKKSDTVKELRWSGNSSADGYQIQYAQNRLFSGAKIKKITSGSTGKCKISKLKKGQTYYARIRAYKTVEKVTYYSEWATVSSATGEVTAKVTQLNSNKKILELRALAGQKVGGFDTLQGSCSDGTYAYYLLYNRNTEQCIISKVRMKDLTLEKVSKVLEVAHGNDMTYDARKKCLAVIHYTGKDPKAITKVNPKTLKIIESKHVKIPKKMYGGTKADAENTTSFCAIAYNKSRNQYVVMLSKSHNFVVLDSNLDPVRYINVPKKIDYTVQGIDATADYIMLAQSPDSMGKYNIISIYDWEGNFISKVNVKKGYEIESIYHVGNDFYAGFYRSYYKIEYKTIIKKVKVNGKVVKEKVKVKYKTLQRDNYVYQIRGL